MFESLSRLFLSPSPEARAVIFVITWATLIGVGWLGLQSATLWHQRRLLNRLETLLDGPALRNATPWDFNAAWAAAGGPALPHGWPTTRVRELMAVRAGGPGGAEALRGLAAQRAERLAEVPRYLAGTLILLGLAGTVWGLGAAAAGVYPLLQRTQSLEQLQQLIHPMSAILGGMRTAFGCTAAGVLGSLLLSLLNLLLSQ